jgi:hypothetical protein
MAAAPMVWNDSFHESANGAECKSLGQRPRNKMPSNFLSAEIASAERTYFAPSALMERCALRSLGRWPRLLHFAPSALRRCRSLINCPTFFQCDFHDCEKRFSN